MLKYTSLVLNITSLYLHVCNKTLIHNSYADSVSVIDCNELISGIGSVSLYEYIGIYHITDTTWIRLDSQSDRQKRSANLLKRVITLLCRGDKGYNAVTGPIVVVARHCVSVTAYRLVREQCREMRNYTWAIKRTSSTVLRM
jgi:CRISPR/Cas system-associated protein Cas7 (RAMP superfamily)